MNKLRQKTRYINYKYSKGDPLEILIDTFPELGWDWGILLQNQNFSLKLMEKYVSKIKNNPNVNFNPNITLEFIKKHPEITSFNSFIISAHENKNMTDIENLEWVWDWYNGITNNANISIENIKKKYNSGKKISFSYVSWHKNIGAQDILDNLHMPWDWNYVSKNPNFSFDFFKKAIEAIPNTKTLFDYEIIWKNMKLSTQSVLFFLEDPYFQKFDMITQLMSLNKSITLDIINLVELSRWNLENICECSESLPDETIKKWRENKDINWISGEHISKNPNISIPFLNLCKIKAPHIWNSLDSYELCQNENINHEYIFENGFKIYVSPLSQNPNLTCKFIIKNINQRWNVLNLCSNQFLYKDSVYKKNIKNDIKRRRKTVEKALNLGDLYFTIVKYIGYL